MGEPEARGDVKRRPRAEADSGNTMLKKTEEVTRRKTAQG